MILNDVVPRNAELSVVEEKLVALKDVDQSVVVVKHAVKRHV